MKRPKIVIILHNVRSAHNVGAIFRTADAIGVERIYLSGYTPLPLDRFSRPVKEIAKTALGAEQTIPWEKISRIDPLLTRLSREGWSLVAVEQDVRAQDYKSYVPKGNTVLCLGNEVRGLSPKLKAKFDTLIQIQMHGEKESLNVSVAFGVVLFQLFDR